VGGKEGEGGKERERYRAKEGGREGRGARSTASPPGPTAASPRPYGSVPPQALRPRPPPGPTAASPPGLTAVKEREGGKEV
jgi:hypothetical protein